MRDMTDIRWELLDFAEICKIVRSENVKKHILEKLEIYTFELEKRYGYPEIERVKVKTLLAFDSLDMKAIVEPLERLAERFPKNVENKKVS